MTHLPWYVSQPEFVMKLYSNEPTGTFNYFKKRNVMPTNSASMLCYSPIEAYKMRVLNYQQV